MGNSSSSAPESDPQALALVRQQVRELLARSQSFHSLPAEQQRELAGDMEKIAYYLAAPEGIPGNALPTRRAVRQGREAGISRDRLAGGHASADAHGAAATSAGRFEAGAADQAGAVFRNLLNAVDFPTFVAGLIHGTFDAVIDASIRQMHAYVELVKDVARTVDEFNDEGVSSGQGRDQLDDHGATGQRAAVAARKRLAAQRQQLLATMVLMGVNRIRDSDGD